MKNTWLITGFVSALIVLLIIFYIVWINRGGNNVVSLFGKSVLAPMILAAALLLYDLFTDVPNSKTMFPATFIYSNPNDSDYTQYSALVDFRNFGKRSEASWEYGTSSACDILSYWSGKHLCMANPDDYSALNDEQRAVLSNKNDFYLDLLQLSIWRWMSMRYGVHWDLETYQSVYGFSSGVSGGIPPEGGQEKFIELSDDKILSIFKENALIKTWSRNDNTPSVVETLMSPRLPVGTKIHTIKSPNSRTMRLQTNEIEIKILIKEWSTESGPLPQSGLGGKIRERNFIEDFELQSYLVTVEWDVKALTRWSPNSLHQRRWAEDIAGQLSTEFNWQKIREKIDN